jgi:hypothetical protein
MMPGMPEKRTHDYVRHGTTTLFAAYNTADGTVISSLCRVHASREKIFVEIYLYNRGASQRRVEVPAGGDGVPADLDTSSPRAPTSSRVLETAKGQQIRSDSGADASQSGLKRTWQAGHLARSLRPWACVRSGGNQ